MSGTTYTTETGALDWQRISAALQAPFDPAEVDYRVQGKPGQSGKSQVVAFVDARAVQDRLDDVVGPGNWSFDWQPIVVDKGDVLVAKGTLTVYGVSKSDAGSASNFDASLGAVSHCFKRAAVQWGVGRYLYALPAVWVAAENGRIPDATLRELRARLPRPAGMVPTHAQPTAQPAAASVQQPTPAPQQRPQAAQAAPTVQPESSGEPLATDLQVAAIRNLCRKLGIEPPTNSFTAAQAEAAIKGLNDRLQKQRGTTHSAS